MLCAWLFRTLLREKVMILCHLVDCRYVLWPVKVKYIANTGNRICANNSKRYLYIQCFYLNHLQFLVKNTQYEIKLRGMQYEIRNWLFFFMLVLSVLCPVFGAFWLLSILNSFLDRISGFTYTCTFGKAFNKGISIKEFPRAHG